MEKRDKIEVVLDEKPEKNVEKETLLALEDKVTANVPEQKSTADQKAASAVSVSQQLEQALRSRNDGKKERHDDEAPDKNEEPPAKKPNLNVLKRPASAKCGSKAPPPIPKIQG